MGRDVGVSVAAATTFSGVGLRIINPKIPVISATAMVAAALINAVRTVSLIPLDCDRSCAIVLPLQRLESKF
jgi:hypothetical protein